MAADLPEVASEETLDLIVSQQRDALARQLRTQEMLDAKGIQALGAGSVVAGLGGLANLGTSRPAW